MNWICSIIRISRYTYANRNLVGGLTIRNIPTGDRKFVFCHGRADALGGNQALSVISIQKKRRKLFTPKT